jgi:hypothetical protein
LNPNVTSVMLFRVSARRSWASRNRTCEMYMHALEGQAPDDVILAAYKLPFEAAFGADPAVQYVEVAMGVHTM